MPAMRDSIRDELRACLKRGVGLPVTPDPAALWEATGGDGPLALLVALDFYEAKREVRQEQADADAADRVWRSMAA